MTREEAIEFIAQSVKSDVDMANVADAIEALEQEAFINKPCCISGEVCEHDKNVVLDKIRAEIFEEMFSHSGTGEEVIQAYSDGLKKGLEIFDKYNGKK